MVAKKVKAGSKNAKAKPQEAIVEAVEAVPPHLIVSDALHKKDVAEFEELCALRARSNSLNEPKESPWTTWTGQVFVPRAPRKNSVSASPTSPTRRGLAGISSSPISTMSSMSSAVSTSPTFSVLSDTFTTTEAGNSPPGSPMSPGGTSFRTGLPGSKPELNLYLEARDFFERMISDTGLLAGHEKKPVRFLDIGSAPGSFATAMLKHFPSSTGIGISLPKLDGGNSSHIPIKYIEDGRFEEVWGDATTMLTTRGEINLPAALEEALAVDATSAQHKFDLVMMDCHSLRKQLDVDAQRLWCAQLYSGFSALRKGGSAIIKLFTVEKPMTAMNLYFLRESFKDVKLYKSPHRMQRRAHFYAVAKDFKLAEGDAKLDAVLEGIRNLWYQTLYGGEGSFGKTYDVTDWTFVASADDLKGKFLEWYIEIAKPIWSTEAVNLRSTLRKKKADCSDILKAAS